jgi:hypothetical protein
MQIKISLDATVNPLYVESIQFYDESNEGYIPGTWVRLSSGISVKSIYSFEETVKRINIERNIS